MSEVDIKSVKGSSVTAPPRDGVITNRYSRLLTQDRARGAAQAMLHGAGLTVEDMDKPQVGISAVWWEGNPCNMHLRSLSEQVKKGCTEADLVGLQFNTIGE